MFCGGHFEFLIRARCASARSGTEITENRSESKKMTRDETEMIAFSIYISSRRNLLRNLTKITLWEEEALN